MGVLPRVGRCHGVNRGVGKWDPLGQALAHALGPTFAAITSRSGAGGSTATTSSPAASSARVSFPVPAARSSTMALGTSAS